MVFRIEIHHYYHADPEVMRTLQEMINFMALSRDQVIKAIRDSEGSIQEHISAAGARVSTDIAALNQKIADLTVGQPLTQEDLDDLLASGAKVAASADLIDPATPPPTPPVIPPAPEPEPVVPPTPAPPDTTEPETGSAKSSRKQKDTSKTEG